MPRGDHLIAFVLGLVAGWLVIPMVLGMLNKKG
jgi:uncharacterized transporter YbjL